MARRVKQRNSSGPMGRSVIFETPLGWTAGTWVGGRVQALTFGHDSPGAASVSLSVVEREVEKGRFGTRQGSLGPGNRAASRPLLLEDIHSPDCLQSIEDEFRDEFRDELAAGSSEDDAGQPPVTGEAERVWELARRLVAFGGGEVIDFLDIPLEESTLTPFRRRVTEACRAIPYGTTLTYAELAERVGTPRGARAVGNVMRRNPWPLLVPCHRVVASSGKLGGYSAPDGLSMKRRLLSLESDGLKAPKAANEFREVIEVFVGGGPCITVGSIG